MASAEAVFYDQMLKEMRNLPPKSLDEQRLEGAARPLPPETDRVKITEIMLGGIDGEKLENTTEKAVRGRVILYIHGGGFTTGTARERRSITQYICDTYGYTVYANNYRLAPENVWPSAVEDCVAFYRGMLETWDASQIIVAGESAGGTLVFSLPFQLEKEDLPLPRGIISFSPCTNQAYSFPSIDDNAPTDYMIGGLINSEYQYETVFGQKKPSQEYLRDPLISPFFGDFSGMPPVFLGASASESLFDDARILYARLKAEGHRVFCDWQKDVCHAYVIFPDIPEAKETIRKSMEFAEALFTGEKECVS